MTHRRVTAVAAAAGILVAAIALRARGADDSYVVLVELRNAAGLRPNSDVKVGGVPIGYVESLRVTARETALVELRVEDAVAPVGRDARALVRPANLIGEKFVDLQPGDRSAPAPSETLIPISRTGTPVELDDVLDTLDSPTRIRLQLLIRESGIAMTGRGADFAELMRRLPPALDRTREMVGEFASDNRRLGSLVKQSDLVLAAIARERHALGDLVAGADSALRATAERERQLGETVRKAPPTLGQLRATLGELDATGAQLRPAARGLRRAAPELSLTLRALPGFTEALGPTVRTAREAGPALGRLGQRATPVVRRLAGTSQTLAAYAEAAGPLSEIFDQGIGDFLGTMEGWARAIQGRDGLGHMFRTQPIGNEAALKTLVDRYVREDRDGERGQASRTAPTTAVDAGTQTAPAPVAGRPAASSPPGAPSDPAAVGRLLDYLLGP